MKTTDRPAALVLVSTHCPHCHALEKLLRDRLTTGSIGKLDVVNIEKSPGVAQQYGVRSVPWLQLGDFVFYEAPTLSELDQWIAFATKGDGQSTYIGYLLERGQLSKAIEWIEKDNTKLKAVIPILKDTEVKINVRIGVGALLEHFEDTDAIRAVIPGLVDLLRDSNPTTRIDVCHYLSLTHSSDVVEPLQKMLKDENQQVRQVAQESIEALNE